MADSISFLIANHHIRVVGAKEALMLSSMLGFPVFVTDDPTIEWSVVCGCEISVPKDLQELYVFAFEEGITSCTLAKSGSDYYFLMYNKDCKNPELVMRYAGGDTVESTSCDNPMTFRFALWMAYNMLSASKKVILVHSSVIVHQNRAVLFLGESGTGKSTHTRLWLNHLPDTHLLNDDSPALAVEDGVPIVYGSPWSGKTHCYHQLRFPLAAAVRLSQAPYNRINRLSMIEAFSSLQPSFPPALAQDEHYSDMMVDMLSDVISAVPLYHLACLPDEAAAWTSHDAIYGKL